MAGRIGGALGAIVSTIINVLTLPFRVLGRLLPAVVAAVAAIPEGARHKACSNSSRAPDETAGGPRRSHRPVRCPGVSRPLRGDDVIRG
jgi:hypothetical protein